MSPLLYSVGQNKSQDQPGLRGGEMNSTSLGEELQHYVVKRPGYEEGNH